MTEGNEITHMQSGSESEDEHSEMSYSDSLLWETFDSG